MLGFHLTKKKTLCSVHIMRYWFRLPFVSRTRWISYTINSTLYVSRVSASNDKYLNWIIAMCNRTFAIGGRKAAKPAQCLLFIILWFSLNFEKCGRIFYSNNEQFQISWKCVLFQFVFFSRFWPWIRFNYTGDIWKENETQYPPLNATTISFRCCSIQT